MTVGIAIRDLAFDFASHIAGLRSGKKYATALQTVTGLTLD